MNYGAWRHPLSPYYAQKAGDEKLPKHPKPGAISYRNWFGVTVTAPPGRDSLVFLAKSVAEYPARARSGEASALVGGWAMSNMSPLDFLWSDLPVFDLNPDAAFEAGQFVEAADLASRAMIGALREALGLEASSGSRLDPERDRFFRETEADFVAALDGFAKGRAVSAADWLKRIRAQALSQFDAVAVEGLADLDIAPREADGFSRRATVKKIVLARRGLLAALTGNKIHDALDLPRPDRKGKTP